MHIVIFENAFWTEGSFKRLQDHYATALVQDHLNLMNVADYADAAVISTDVSLISDELLKHLPKLEHIACRGSGVDQIDLPACASRGISVSCVPGYAETVVDEVLSQADILSLHIPGGPENRHLLSDQAFAGMKQGVLLINTARGDLIDNKALLAALEAGTISGAGLDVLPEEALLLKVLERPETPIHDPRKADIIQDNLRLLAHPRVIVTPHSGFFSREGVRALLETTEDNILAFCRGAPQNIVS